jgi:hypothetical protein
MAAVSYSKRPSGQGANGKGVEEPDVEAFVRPTLKVTDLPITAAQQATIQNLVKSFQKGGGFDVIRKDIWSQFVQSVRCLSRTDAPSLYCLLTHYRNRKQRTP